LESIIADVLRDLGFNVVTNTKMEARRGGQIEVDVYATKWVSGTKFSIYVSCKNWDKKVGRDVIDEEFGRVNNLKKTPHLKIIVAKELTDPAREAAQTDGFMVIGLGEKTDTRNTAEIYQIIYKALN